jgi:transposase InsO family protein
MPECEWTSSLSTQDLQLRDRDHHCRMVHPERWVPAPGAGEAAAPQARAKPESLPRPSISEGATEADFTRFQDKWARYKRSTLANYSPQHVSDQLWACCSPELETAVYNTGASSDTAEAELMEGIKRLAVRRQNCLVNVTQFLDMAQDTEEAAGSFMARLKGQASTCSYNLKCPADGCGRTVNYSEQMVAHQLVRGLADPVIQEQVLAQGAESGAMDLAKIIKFIEAKEAGKRSSLLLTSAGGLNKMSEYQKGKHIPKPDQTNCKFCGSDRCRRKTECWAREKNCNWCQSKGHAEKACNNKKNGQPKRQGSQGAGTNSLLSSQEPSQQVGAGSFCNLSTDNVAETRAIGHFEYVGSQGWVARRAESHPTLQVSVSVCSEAYPALRLPPPRARHSFTTANALADTGAQLTVAGPSLLRSLRISEQELLPLSNSVTAANQATLDLKGGVFITISGRDRAGETRVTRQLCYIAGNTSHLFISKAGCRDLGIVDDQFPRVGSSPAASVANIGEQEDDAKAHGEPDHKLSGYGSNTKLSVDKTKEMIKCEHDEESNCVCLRRTMAPDAPTSLPFLATEQNREKLQQWILDFYASSAFNQCECQPLPLMQDSPPLKLFIDPAAEPVAIHKARPVPIHFQAKVKAGLDRDCALGVLEKVPVGSPTGWCSPMGVHPKKNGEPRRVVDLQALNRVAVRQTHATESPFHQAVGIPKGTYKTVLDAFEGYHSVPLHPSDTHYTEFISPWGRYRYLTSPQGFLAAGDGYTARYDEIVKDVTNYKKCIDDTCLWDESLEGVFYRTCRYLTLCSRAGIIFNRKKFQFGSETVDFLGFTITRDSVKPSADYIQAIRDFPRPTDITGARSWFGLINQVSYAFAMTDSMLPFRELLKPSTQFLWTPEMEQAFIHGKEEIVKAVIDGVKSYEMGRTTALCTDFSKAGLGFVLLQKHCSCSGPLPSLTPSPICCNRWKLVFAGSRFTSPAEARYNPGQGEALAVAWSLHKARHYCLGNPDLVLAVDHKPLLRILGDKNLDDIDDPRMVNLKEKTLRYSFRIVHIPGKKHSGPDAASRSPVGPGEHMELAAITLASLKEEEREELRSVVQHLVAGLRQGPTLEEEEAALYREQLALGSAFSCLAALTLSPGQEEGLQCNVAALTSPQAISWADLDSAAAADPLLPALAALLRRGAPEDSSLWPEELSHFHPHRQHLSLAGGMVVYKGRAVVATALRPALLETLHSGHQGCTGMLARASQSVWWPSMSTAIERRRQSCRGCDAAAPSQPAAPPQPLPQPEYPFQMLSSDYFSYSGKDYFVINCRYSNFLSVFHGSPNSADFIKALREFFRNWGIPSELATDGATVFTSQATQQFLRRYGVSHRVSSSYFPHSNQFAEGSVKVAKRMIRDNTGSDGKLNTDQFVRALLQHRNTVDQTGSSPALTVFGRALKDFFPGKPGALLHHPEWRHILDQRELALARRHSRRGEELSEHTKVLRPLTAGQVVLVQNQQGNKPKRWDRTGLVVETLPHDQYLVRMDGSGQATTRNRRFLRPTTPFSCQGAPALDLVEEPYVPPPPAPLAPQLNPAALEEPAAAHAQEERAPAALTDPPRRSTRRRRATRLADGALKF